MVDIDYFKRSHYYNTRVTNLNPIRTHNERGGRSLWNSDIALCNLSTQQIGGG